MNERPTIPTEQAYEVENGQLNPVLDPSASRLRKQLARNKNMKGLRRQLRIIDALQSRTVRT